MNNLEYNKDTNIAEFTAERDAILTQYNALLDIIPIIRRFDGKVINKRFTDQCTNATDTDIWVRVEQLGRSWYLYIRLGGEKRRYSDNEYTHYIVHDEASMIIELDENKRLLLGETLKNVENKKEELKDRANEYNDAIHHYDEYVEKAREMQKLCKEYMENSNKYLRLDLRSEAVLRIK